MTERTPAARRSIVGAVAALWLIVVVILWMGTLGLWYMASRAAGEGDVRASTATAKYDELKAEADAQKAAFEALSAKVGYRASPDAKSDPGAIQIEIDGAKADLGDAMAADATPTLAETVAALRTALTSARQSAESTKTDFASELAQRSAAESTANEVEGKYSGELQTAQQALADANQRADNQSASDLKRIDEVTAAQLASDAAARQAQQALAEVEVKSRRDLSLVSAQLKAVALRREPRAPEAPDGTVLEVGAGGSLAFIDIGRRSGLRLGTRFEMLRPAENGELVKFGNLFEVRELDDNFSMVGVVGEPDPLDPILPGDKVRNPHFDKTRVMRHYLLGEYPLTMSKDFVSARLAELGAAVDTTLGTQTDVLVIGDRPLSEGEGKDLTDTDEYKLADKLGMRIVRLADLADFLRYN